MKEKSWRNYTGQFEDSVDPAEEIKWLKKGQMRPVVEMGEEDLEKQLRREILGTKSGAEMQKLLDAAIRKGIKRAKELRWIEGMERVSREVQLRKYNAEHGEQIVIYEKVEDPGVNTNIVADFYVGKAEASIYFYILENKFGFSGVKVWERGDFFGLNFTWMERDLRLILTVGPGYVEEGHHPVYQNGEVVDIERWNRLVGLGIDPARWMRISRERMLKTARVVANLPQKERTYQRMLELVDKNIAEPESLRQIFADWWAGQ